MCDLDSNNSRLNLIKYCENKLSDHELELDPDVNFFNNVDIPMTLYYDIENIKNYSTSLKHKFPFTLMHINCRSILNKINEIKFISEILKINLFAVTESWLQDDSAKLISMDGFTFEHKARNNSKKGGGVGFLIENSIRYEVIEITTPEYNTFEYLAIKVLIDNAKNISLICVYRPPGTPIDLFNSEFDSLLNNNVFQNNVIIMGDLNINLLKTDSHSPTADFNNMMLTNRYISIINKPTRVTPFNETLIDNFFTNFYSNSINSAILQYPISDHYPIILSLDLKPNIKSTNPTIKHRNLSTKNKNYFIERIKSVDWGKVKQACFENKTDHAYSIFLEIFSHHYNESFPISIKTSLNKFKKPWLTPALYNSIKTKNKLYKKYLKNPSSENKKSFNKFNNIFKLTMRKAEKLYYSNKINKNSNSNSCIWKSINNILNNSVNTTSEITLKPLIDDQGILNDNISIPDRLNNYFVNVGKEIASNIQSIPSNDSIYDTLSGNSKCQTFQIYPTTPNEVNDIIKNLKHKNSSGHDDINQNIVILCADYISEIISDIINSSFSTGIVPQELKIAKVIPIFKSGSKCTESNYRPISNLSIFSKILEKAMFNRCINYLDKYKMLTDYQFGFRANHSTYMPIMNLVDLISSNFELHHHSIGIFLDLKKAFDVIDHKILLNKLAYYGFKGLSHTWFSNYLTNRIQFTWANSLSSELKNIEYGVPQGSILGPLLFLIFINDLPNISTFFKYLLFADDTNLVASHYDLKELTTQINLELVKISQWFNINKLALNLEKTNFIYFHIRNKVNNPLLDPIKINDTILTQKSSIKFLGIIVDEHLNWKNHIVELSNKLSKNLNLIRHIKYLLDSNALQKLYFTLIHSYLTYCTIIWGNTYKSNINKLQILQNKSIRLIFNDIDYTNTTNLFNKFNILKIKNIHKLQSAVFIFKYRHNLLPPLFYLNKFFEILTTKSNLNLRNKENIYIQYASTNTRIFTIKFAGPRFWNSLPHEIKNSNHITSFKKEVKNYLTKIQN